MTEHNTDMKLDKIININDVRDTLIGAAIGLVRVCEHHPRTPEGTLLLLEAMYLLQEGRDMCPEPSQPHALHSLGEYKEICPESDPSSYVHCLRDLTARIHEETFRISPGCRTCASPCGGVGDYNMKEYHDEADEDIRNLKAILLDAGRRIGSTLYRRYAAELKGTASSPYKDDSISNLNIYQPRPEIPTEDSECIHLLYRSLFAIGEDWEAEWLLELAMEVNRLLLN